MKTRVSFYRADTEDHLFNEHLSQIPRVGDLVLYSFEPLLREEWDSEAYESKRAASDLIEQPWQVIEVLHTIRRLTVGSDATQVVVAYIKPTEVD